MTHDARARHGAPAGRAAGGAVAALLRAAMRLAHGARAGLGLAVLVGGAAMLLGGWAFVALAEAVGEGATQAFDEAALRRLDAVHAPWVDPFMVEVTALGNNLVVLTLAVVAGTVFWLTRHRYAAALLAAASVGGVLLNVLLKSHFARPRPQVVEWGTHVATSSFPSGHATSAIVVYATVAFLVTRLQRGRLARAATTLLAAAVILLVAASRLFLGVHYPTDVAAGLAIGLAWAAFCMALLSALHRMSRQERPELARDELPPPAP